jgi:hypothetical protein
MTINNFSVGKDLTFNLYDPMTGGVVSFPIITGFDRKQLTTKLHSKAMSGRNYYGTEYDGWELSITIDRASAAADRFFAQREAAYHGGQNMLELTVTETIQEKDGTITQFRYEGVDVSFDDAGTFKNGALVQQRISGRASRRVLIN